MLRRQKPDEWHNYPEHRRGLEGVLRGLLWRLGFDPLTVYERLAQMRRENADWKRWLAERNNDIALLEAAVGELAEDRERLLDEQGA